MKFLKIFFNYLKWHYGKALLKTFELWKNILVFLLNYFSIKNLIGNFFTPWKRLVGRYPRGFKLSEYLSIFISNMIMRIVGMLMRSVMLIVGLTFCCIYIILLPIGLVAWLVLPVFIIWLLLYGIVLVIFG